MFDKINEKTRRKKVLTDAAIGAIGNAVGFALGGLIIGLIIQRANGRVQRNVVTTFRRNPLDEEEAESLLDDARWFGEQYQHFKGQDPEREGYYYGMTTSKADAVLRFSDDPQMREKALGRLYKMDREYYVER